MLAEFILKLAKESPSVTEFEKLLIENEAEFSIDLINAIYANVTRMLPENFKGAKPKEEKSHFVKGETLVTLDEEKTDKHLIGLEEDKFDKSEAHDKGFLTKKYPSLAMPNIKNKEEIDILDDLEEA